MRRRNLKGRESAEPAPDRPVSLMGAFLLATVSSDGPDRDRLAQRVKERFPHGAVDQGVVGRIVFERLARDLFASHPSDSPMVEEFGTSLVGIMGPGTSVRAADMVAAIRAALRGASPPVLSDPLDFLNIHVGFVTAAIGQLEPAPAQVAAMFAEAEREAAGRGVWLVPRDEQSAEPSAAAAEASGPWDVADLADPQAGRIDFGSLLLRLPKGSTITVEQSDGENVAIGVDRTHTTMLIQVFAAPPGGMWAAVRRELAASVARGGGTAREVAGLGAELWTQTAEPGAAQDFGIKHMRFVGKDGPGWCCRAVLEWRGVPDPEEHALLENVFRDAVVVRGDAALPDCARLPLVVP